MKNYLILAVLVLGLLTGIAPAVGEITVGDNITFLAFDEAGSGLEIGTVWNISEDGEWLLIYVPPNYITVVSKWFIYSDETMANQLLTNLLLSNETYEPVEREFQTGYMASNETRDGGREFGETAVKPSEQVNITVYVREGDLDGATLSGVMVSGKDADGNNFEKITDSNGVVTITGEPGTWQFTFAKEGYEALNLNYDVTETGEGGVYLKKINQSSKNSWIGQQQASEDQLWRPNTANI